MRLLSIMIAIALMGAAAATMSADELSKAKALIYSNASCDKLSQDQLELIGDYYMEQMHPGQQHEIMDRMMGGEGSPQLRQQHIQIALVLYCGRTDTNVTYGGMMAMMPVFYSGGGSYRGVPGAFGTGMIGGGMMGGSYSNGGLDGLGWVLGLVFWVLVLIALILLIVWLYKGVSGAGGKQSASEILRQRYAKGEISKKQYEEMKKDLE
jgi:uncharacterized membrane protein